MRLVGADGLGGPQRLGLRDAEFVETLSESRGVPCFVQRFDIQSFIVENGGSTQIAARLLRYNWFAELCQFEGFTHVATGHHLNDAAETLLHNLLRGTGLRGLRGIPPITEWQSSTNPIHQCTIVRPLLFATRDEVRIYAEDHDLAWREDSSNASDYYTRNQIRHHLFPQLEAIQPDWVHVAGRTMQRLAESQANHVWLIRAHLAPRATQYGFSVEMSDLASLPYPADALVEWLRDYGFTPDQCQQIAQNLSKTGLDIISDRGARLVVDRTQLILETTQREAPANTVIQADDLMIRLPSGGQLVLMQADAQPPFPDGRTAIIVDYEQIAYPLTLRPWQAGDVFQPFGMGGQRQKLQDYLTNQKLSKPEKEDIRVLTDAQGRIIWILGHRMDERFKVTALTQKALKISWLA
jgi:tRNA(Ile)-lysidine synthase